jgi:hypothetical protein
MIKMCHWPPGGTHRLRMYLGAGAVEAEECAQEDQVALLLRALGRQLLLVAVLRDNLHLVRRQVCALVLCGGAGRVDGSLAMRHASHITRRGGARPYVLMDASRRRWTTTSG